MQVENCPFFVRSGFCPRRPLCKLDHSYHSSTSQSATILTGSPSKISPNSQAILSPTTILGQPKRFHPMEENNEEENPVANSLITSTNTVASTTITVDTVPTVTVSGAKRNDTIWRVPHYHRSVSLPATNVQRSGPPQPDPSSPSSQGAQGGGGEGENRSVKQASNNTDNQMMSLELQGVSPLGSGSSTVVPKVFDFYRSSEGVSGEEEERTEGVFVFTASPSKTGETEEEEGEEVRGKPCLLAQLGDKEEERKGGNHEMVAELAQQLQLDSDNVSEVYTLMKFRGNCVLISTALSGLNPGRP